ncbi:MAG TPA: GNAT family N-acetyltransferase [Methylobacter sp.]
MLNAERIREESMYINLNRMQKDVVSIGLISPQLKESEAHPASQYEPPNNLKISCYESEVPGFVDAELVRLYGNLYSSIAHLKLNGNLRTASTYVVSNDDEIVTVFLFQMEGDRVNVLNEVIRVEQEDIDRFSGYIFQRFRKAQIIRFRAIHTDISSLRYRHQRYNYLEDFVVDLPDDTESYLAMLGKNTRRNLRRYQKSLLHDFPEFSFQFCETGQVQESDIREIIALNRERMSDKNKIPSIDEAETEKLLRLVAQSGLVGIARINGRICGGAISYRVGGNYFLLTLAHDPAYNKYSLGMLCCFLLICEVIDRGGAEEFHFLWGRYEYKQFFMGIRRDLDYLAVYRSSTQYVLNAPYALRLALMSKRRQFSLWFHDSKRPDTLMSRLIVRALNFFMQLKGRNRPMPGR